MQANRRALQRIGASTSWLQMPGRVYGIAALPRAASRALATSAPQAVVVSPHQLGQATEPSKEDEGHTDWYYVSWGSLFLFLVGGPFYFVYLLKEDDELRIFADEHFPGAVAAVKQLVNVDEVRSDPHYQNIDQFGEGTFSLHAEAPSTHNTSEQNADETLIVPVNGEAQVVTLSSASTAAAAAKSLGISEQDFINTAKISEEDIIKLEATLQDLYDAESDLRSAEDLPLIEQDMLETRLQHIGGQQQQVQHHILAARAQLREINRKWYEFW